MVNSRIRRMISSSISVSSERLTNGSTSCSRVLTRAPRSATKARRHEDCLVQEIFFVPSWLRGKSAQPRSWNRHSVDHVGDHAVGGEAVAGGVRAEPDAVIEDVGGEILDVLGVDVG